MKINQNYRTHKLSSGINTAEYIMLHHTWPGNDIDLVNYLSKHTAEVSCHFVVWRDWIIYHLANLNDITWHAWFSKWDWKTWLNKYSIWIEIVSDWYSYTQEQKEAVRELVTALLKHLNLTHDKIITHADVSGYRGKWDVWPNFYWGDWMAYQNTYKREEEIDPTLKNMLIDLANKNSTVYDAVTDTRLQDLLHQVNDLLRSRYIG